MHAASVKAIIDPADPMAPEVSETVSATRERLTRLLRIVLWEGLSMARNRLQVPRPERYLAVAYRNYPGNKCT